MTKEEFFKELVRQARIYGDNGDSVETFEFVYSVASQLELPRPTDAEMQPYKYDDNDELVGVDEEPEGFKDCVVCGKDFTDRIRITRDGQFYHSHCLLTVIDKEEPYECAADCECRM